MSADKGHLDGRVIKDLSMRHERDEKLFPDLIVKSDHQNAKDILS